MTYDLSSLAEELVCAAEKYEHSTALSLCGPDGIQRLRGDGVPGEYYLVDGAGGFLLGMSLAALMDDGLLSAETLPSEIISAERLPRGKEASVGRLMRRVSGLPDPICGVLLPDLYRAPELSGLSDSEKKQRANAAILEHRSLDRQMELLGGGKRILRLRRVPSSLETAILAEIAEELSPEGLMDLQRVRILEPLGITPLACQPDYEAHRIHALTLDQLERLTSALASGKLAISDRCRSLCARPTGKHSLPFSAAGNVMCGHSCVSGHTVDIIFDPDGGVGVLSASREPLPIVRQGDSFRRIDADIVYHMNSAGVFPRDTRLEKLTGHYLPDLLSIRLEEEQLDYVSTPAMLLAHMTLEEFRNVFRVYMIVDSGTVAGVLAVTPGAGKDSFVLDTLIIDRRFQRRGFGKAALRLLTDLLKGEGGRELAVCVSPSNTAALGLYEAFGFELALVHSDSLVLRRAL